MSETQLREAFALMKQGDKQGAARLVQNVLKEDRSNIQAWWLFSHLLDDEDKIVKSLEKVLALNPEHPGARKRLAELRPEYAHLAAQSPEKEKAKQVADKLYTVPPKRKTRASAGMGGCLFILASRLGLRLLIMLVFVIGASIFGYFSSKEKQASLPDINGDTPQVIAERYYDALYSQDADRLYAITCPARHQRIDEMVEDFDINDPDSVVVDLSATRFSLSDYRNSNKAYVAIHGTMSAEYAGSSFSMDWDADAEAEGYDGYGIFLERVDGAWLICNPYDIPDMEFNDE